AKAWQYMAGTANLAPSAAPKFSASVTRPMRRTTVRAARPEASCWPTARSAGCCAKIGRAPWKRWKSAKQGVSIPLLFFPFGHVFGLVQKRLGPDGTLFASVFPWELAVHVRVEALKQREAGKIPIIEPDRRIDPVRIVADVDWPDLHVMATTDGVGITGARLELLPLADA